MRAIGSKNTESNASVPVIEGGGQGRDNVLILGFTYTDTVRVMEKSRKIFNFIDVPPAVKHGCNSTQCADWLLLHKLIGPTEHRDLYRALLVEQYYNCRVYTCALEKMFTLRKDRHYVGNFDKSKLVFEMSRQFPQVVFQQISIDYIFHQTGYADDRYKNLFWDFNLVQFVTPREGTNATTCFLAMDGLVFIPFSASNFKALYLQQHMLNEWYNISYLYDIDLLDPIARKGRSFHRLHGATELIGEEQFAKWGKVTGQEKSYCKVNRSQIKQVASDAKVVAEDLLEAWDDLPNAEDARFIQLKRTGTNIERTDLEYMKSGRSPVMIGKSPVRVKAAQSDSDAGPKKFELSSDEQTQSGSESEYEEKP